MPRPDSYGGEHERHGTAFESLPNGPWRCGCKPDDTTIPSTERQYLRNAALFLSQLPQKDRRGRERASPDQTSDDQVRKSERLFDSRRVEPFRLGVVTPAKPSPTARLC